MILGIMGSLHCVGMCGPIAMLVSGNSKRQYIANRLTYHLGRTITYMTMGLAVGLVGRIFQLGSMQSMLSLVGGAVILIFLFLPRITFLPSSSILIYKLKGLLSNAIRSRGTYATLFTGILNGFLPCGLVYSALALALVQSSTQESVIVMAVFGLGTIPALLAFTYSANVMKRVMPFSVNKFQRVALLAVALIMIWRGLMFGWPQAMPEDPTCQGTVVASSL